MSIIKWKNFLNKNKKLNIVAIIGVLIVIIYFVFFKINISMAQDYYNAGKYEESAEACKYLIQLFSPEKIERYKCASELGDYYQRFIGDIKCDIPKLQYRALRYFMFGLNECKDRKTSYNSQIEKEEIEKFETMYYEIILEEYDIKKEEVDEVIYKFDEVSLQSPKIGMTMLEVILTKWGTPDNEYVLNNPYYGTSVTWIYDSYGSIEFQDEKVYYINKTE